MTNKEALRILLAIENRVPLTDTQVIAIHTAIKALTQVTVEQFRNSDDGWWVSENNSNYSPFDDSEENV